MNSLERILAANTMFAGLPQNELADLADNAIQRTYVDQEIIVHQEDVWPYLFLIAEGKIDAIKESAEGRAFIATSLNVGDVFWGLAFFIQDAPMPVLLQAKDATQGLYMEQRSPGASYSAIWEHVVDVVPGDD